MAGGLGFPNWGGHAHYINKCEHGTVVSQCRCPGGTVKIVDCPEWCVGDVEKSDEV